MVAMFAAFEMCSEKLRFEKSCIIESAFLSFQCSKIERMRDFDISLRNSIKILKAKQDLIR